MITKKCNKCGKIKSINEFRKGERYKDKHRNECRKCESEYLKEYYKKNPEYYREYIKNNPEKNREANRKWRINNPDKVKIKNKKYYEYCKKNEPERLRDKEKKRMSNPKYRLNRRIFDLIRYSLKSNKGGRYWENLVGYTLQDLKLHLEKQFKEDMSWENHGAWQIDHIKPISSFNFDSYEDPEFKECWKLSNLQPLWTSENLSKGVRIIAK